MTETIKLTDIIVGDRLRKDYGDLSDLDTIPERGLIQPLVLNKNVQGQLCLVAGGRRLAKLSELGVEELHHGVTCTPGTYGFVYANELPPDVAREIELYENIGRKPMSWKERVLSIAEIHELKCKRAALDSESWGLRESGAEIGVEYSYISRMVMIAKELKKPDSTIHNCKNAAEAIRWFAEIRENEAKTKLAQLTVAKIPSTAPIPVAESNETGKANEVKQELIVPLSKMLLQGKMEDVIGSTGAFVDHIITDWPYGIDMANLSQENSGMNITRVDIEHDAKDNIVNFPIWLEKMYQVLKPNGFCVIFYDDMQAHLMRTLAEQLGFRVQRWPIVWIKTSPCLNQQAYKNFTKATEFAMVLSKGNSLLVKPQSTNYWSGPRASSTSNPFAKPEGLWHFIMSAVCTPGETVLDPFAGEGSSTLAAIKFGLRPIAIESNENHFNQLNNNVRELYQQLTKENVRFE
jgi:site-specific DNA-methyltransferase (adenine-specific)